MVLVVQLTKKKINLIHTNHSLEYLFGLGNYIDCHSIN